MLQRINLWIIFTLHLIGIAVCNKNATNEKPKRGLYSIGDGDTFVVPVHNLATFAQLNALEPSGATFVDITYKPNDPKYRSIEEYFPGHERVNKLFPDNTINSQNFLPVQTPYQQQQIHFQNQQLLDPNQVLLQNALQPNLIHYNGLPYNTIQYGIPNNHPQHNILHQNGLPHNGINHNGIPQHGNSQNTNPHNQIPHHQVQHNQSPHNNNPPTNENLQNSVPQNDNPHNGPTHAPNPNAHLQNHQAGVNSKEQFARLQNNIHLQHPQLSARTSNHIPFHGSKPDLLHHANLKAFPGSKPLYHNGLTPLPTQYNQLQGHPPLSQLHSAFHPQLTVPLVTTNVPQLVHYVNQHKPQRLRPLHHPGLHNPGHVSQSPLSQISNSYNSIGPKFFEPQVFSKPVVPQIQHYLPQVQNPFDAFFKPRLPDAIQKDTPAVTAPTAAPQKPSNNESNEAEDKKEEKDNPKESRKGEKEEPDEKEESEERNESEEDENRDKNSQEEPYDEEAFQKGYHDAAKGFPAYNEDYNDEQKYNKPKYYNDDDDDNRGTKYYRSNRYDNDNDHHHDDHDTEYAKQHDDDDDRRSRYYGERGNDHEGHYSNNHHKHEPNVKQSSNKNHKTPEPNRSTNRPRHPPHSDNQKYRQSTEKYNSDSRYESNVPKKQSLKSTPRPRARPPQKNEGKLTKPTYQYGFEPIKKPSTQKSKHSEDSDGKQSSLHPVTIKKVYTQNWYLSKTKDT